MDFCNWWVVSGEFLYCREIEVICSVLIILNFVVLEIIMQVIEFSAGLCLITDDLYSDNDSFSF